MRVALTGAKCDTVIVKHVHWPPKFAGSEISHRRKIRSYQVEIAWYRTWSDRCSSTCRVPKCWAAKVAGDEVWMVLEDLDAAGFSSRKQSASVIDAKLCLTWLANFHATFLGERPKDLWKVGTYWHLDTRPEEWKILQDAPLKQAAATLDQKLRASQFQTFVHGDAKLENFCFTKNGSQVAAVDFQYVGGGCGMKDVAYLLDSCFSETTWERLESELLTYYFSCLHMALKSQNKTFDFDALEQDWRSLYPVAVADFHRFLKGWTSSYWAKNGYRERVTR